MRCVLALGVVLLAACGEQPADHHVDTLAADPMRLKALRAQCAANPQVVMQATGEDVCRAAAEAFRRRFVSGGAGLDEHQTLSDLPSIPPSFKEPADGVAPAFPAEQEGTP